MSRYWRLAEICLAIWPMSACTGTFSGNQPPPLAEVSVLDYGAIPDDGENDADALREALEANRSRKGIRLVLPPGRYDFRDEQAVALMQAVLSGRFGHNPEPTIFRPYYPYVRGLDFTGYENVEVEATGAELICDGWMEPVSIDRCRSFQLRGLTIDYRSVPYSLGKVVEVGPDWFEVHVDSRYPVRAGIPVPRIGFWDSAKSRIRGTFAYPLRAELVDSQRLRIYSRVSPDLVGETAVCYHGFHFRPAILIQDSQDVLLEHVTIHSQPGMGIVGNHSTNLTFRNLRVVPRAGSFVSTNTDATHFTSCDGLLRFQDCQFEGQGDDSANIHNYYYTLEPVWSPRACEIRVDAPTGTHAQVLDCPDVGDLLELVEKETLHPVGEFRVQSAERFPAEWRAILTLDRELPKELDQYLLINVSRLPKVEITGCQVRGHRARAFLIKTRNVLIENCTIENTTGTAIHVGAEGFWHEGPASANVTIQYNRIIGCGYGEGNQNGTSGIAVNVEAARKDIPGIHRGIVIQGNQIVAPEIGHGIFVSGAEDVSILYNQVVSRAAPIWIQHSTGGRIAGNGAGAVEFGLGYVAAAEGVN